MREHRKRIDRLQNLLIAVLVCTALVLINQTGMFRNLTGGSAGTPVEASFTGVQDTALSRQAPVALLIQTSSGRYGRTRWTACTTMACPPCSPPPSTMWRA